jgi:retron-type reverse transcriptase
MTWPWIALGLIFLGLVLGLKLPNHPLHVLRAWLGYGKKVDELAEMLGTATHKLAEFESRYTRATIPKKSGGTRELWIPDEKTKALQRRLLRRVFARLRVHGAARGFERGRSIVHNALPHVGRAIVIRLDVVDFFPSTHSNRVERYFRRVGWNRHAAALLTRLTTHDGGLPQGAPTSPRLSNLVNFGIDCALERWARIHDGAYTRYADDITFSLSRDDASTARILIVGARNVLARAGYRLHRRRKMHIRRRHQRQVVTGLVVNEKIQLPRARRRWLRAVRHRLATGRPATIEAHQLDGWTALERMIRDQR